MLDLQWRLNSHASIALGKAQKSRKERKRTEQNRKDQRRAEKDRKEQKSAEKIGKRKN